MIKIAPSLLAVVDQSREDVDFSRLEEAINKSRKANLFHIDVMDGEFVPQKTPFLNPDLIRRINKLGFSKDLDVHLMVKNPEEYARDFENAGARYISFHIEAMHSLEQTEQCLNQFARAGSYTGIALNPDTPVSRITELFEPRMIGCIDYITVMSVVPGKCGQGYIPEVTEKIKELAKFKRANRHNFWIQVDGGIKLDNAYIPTNAGADILVSGSGIYSQPDYNEAIMKMKDVILIGSDHGGLKLKSRIMEYFDSRKIAYQDSGTYSAESCDYPDIAKNIAKQISEEECRRGILVCGTGLGMSMTANRHKNVRAAVAYDEFTAKMSREHNDSNILCLGERSLKEDNAMKILETWLYTNFSSEERHRKRIEIIDKD